MTSHTLDPILRAIHASSNGLQALSPPKPRVQSSQVKIACVADQKKKAKVSHTHTLKTTVLKPGKGPDASVV